MNSGYILIIIYVFSTSLGLIFVKIGSATNALVEIIDGKIALHPTLFNMIGMLLYGISFLLYLYLIAKNDLGYIIPLTTALVYVIIFLASYTVFREVFTLAKIIGIILIITGVVLLNIRQ